MSLITVSGKDCDAILKSYYTDIENDNNTQDFLFFLSLNDKDVLFCGLLTFYP